MEEWMAIADYPDYEVSNEGRVRSWRGNGRKRADRSRPLTGALNADGYRRIILCAKGQLNKTISVHILILEAFKGKRPLGMQACHNDSNPSNNHINNLRWGTPKDNYSDRFANGTDNTGERNGRAVLKATDIPSIAKLRECGKSYKEIAERYSIGIDAIFKIITGKSWRHVER